MDLERLKNILAGFKGRQLLVLGDLMLDEYIWGQVDRISPEAPVQVVEVKKDAYTLGGAGNVVNNLVSLGARVKMVSIIGNDSKGALLKDELHQLGVETGGIICDERRCTISKTRVIAVNQQVVRLDREDRRPIGENMEDKMVDYISGHLDRIEVILVSDYLKGTITPRLLQAVIKEAKRYDIPVIVDPKGIDYTKYTGVTIITPNKKEAALAAGMEIDGEEQVIAAANKLLDKLDLKAVLITRSQEGMSLLERGKPIINIPTRAREVYDVSGAGDTVLAGLGVGLANKLSLTNAATIANIAAGIVVSKVGTASVTCDEIIDYVAGEQHYSDNKVKNLDDLKKQVSLVKMQGKRIVAVFGCFDRLQVKRIKFLQRARRLGDMLIVGLWSDEVIQHKENGKLPSISEEERAHIISALDCVSYLTVLNRDGSRKFLRTLRPHILALTTDEQHPRLEKSDLDGLDLEVKEIPVD